MFCESSVAVALACTGPGGEAVTKAADAPGGAPGWPECTVCALAPAGADTLGWDCVTDAGCNWATEPVWACVVRGSNWVDDPSNISN